MMIFLIVFLWVLITAGIFMAFEKYNEDAPQKHPAIPQFNMMFFALLWPMTVAGCVTLLVLEGAQERERARNARD